MSIDLNEGVTAANLKQGTEVFFSPDIEINDRSTVIDSYSIVP
jgi:hypothetical protein